MNYDKEDSDFYLLFMMLSIVDEYQISILYRKMLFWFILVENPCFLYLVMILLFHAKGLSFSRIVMLIAGLVLIIHFNF